MSNLSDMQHQITKEAENNVESISLFAEVLMIITVILAFVLVIMVLPLYYYSQVQNQQLLQLFATISNDNLKQMLEPIQNVLFQEKKVLKNSMQYMQKSNFKKRKLTSNTSVIPKFKPLLFVSTILIFTFIIIQPIVNYFLMIKLQNELQLITSILGFFIFLIILLHKKKCNFFIQK